MTREEESVVMPQATSRAFWHPIICQWSSVTAKQRAWRNSATARPTSKFCCWSSREDLLDEQGLWRRILSLYWPIGICTRDFSASSYQNASDLPPRPRSKALAPLVKYRNWRSRCHPKQRLLLICQIQMIYSVVCSRRQT